LYTGGNKSSKKKYEKLKKALSEKSPTSIFFIAFDKDNEKIVGSVCISFKKTGRIRHRVDLGWGVYPDYQGNGIGTRLLKRAIEYSKKRGFKRAEAEMAIKNKASWKIALKNGFKIEGTKKRGLLLDNGKYADTYIVGKLL